MSFSSRLRKARQQKKFIQKQLGNMLGVSDSSICGYENGLRSPSTDLLLKLMSTLSDDASCLYQDGLSVAKFSANTDEVELVELYRGAEIMREGQ